jgi:phosphate transport system permease protein
MISRMFKYISCLAMFLSLSVLGLIVFIILYNGINTINWDFLFGEFDILHDKVSLLPSIVSTFILIVTTVSVSMPIGIFTAIYLNEYTRSGNKLVKYVKVAIDVLSGVPSIIFALFGIILFVVFLNMGFSLIAGALTMVIMVLPAIIRATEEALKAVPSNLREGSFALGAGKVSTVFKVVLPGAFPGITAAVILSVGRIIGESAVIIFTVGTDYINVPAGLLSRGSSLASTLYAFANSGFIKEAYGAGVVLLIIVFGLNLISFLIENKYKKKNK